jgi:hypothetical protein
MECTLATLIACFGWSHLYLDGGLAYQDAGMYHQIVNESAATVVVDGNVTTASDRQIWQYDHPANPYGRLALGYELHFESISWRLEATHISSVASTKDRGINSLSINARWHPFRR